MTTKKTGFQGIIIGCVLWSSSFHLAADNYSDAISAVESGNYQSAIDSLNSILQSKRNDPRALLILANTRKAMGELDQAKMEYENLIALYPDMPEPYNNLALIYADEGDTTKAIDYLLKVFETNQTYALAYQNLRTIYNDIASEAYREALDITDKPQSKSPLFTLQDIYAQQTIVASEQPITTSASKQASSQEVATVSSEKATSTNPVINTKNTEQAQSNAIKDTIRRWAAAWSSQDVDAYLNFYHRQFVAPGSRSRSDWESNRQQRLSAPSYIRVEVSNIDVEITGTRSAIVNFDQKYRASNYSDDTSKKMSFVFDNGAWKIVTEQTL